MKINKQSPIYLQAMRAKSIDLQQKKVFAILINNKYLSDINREQMREGLTSEGNPITPDYSRGYAWFKERLSSYKAPPGTPDLFVTGAFQSGLFLILRNGVDFTSSDSKVGRLTSRYGRKIFGIAPAYKSKAVAIVTNSYVKFVAKELRK